METIMSVDVEEWFHIPLGLDNALPFNQWDMAEQRVQNVLPKMLDIFQHNNIKATFFFLGWIAEKYPHLVKEVEKHGHEIATHGYAHKMIYNQTRKEFDNDVYKATSILRNITGQRVIGYRAPGFSITPETVWAYDILANHGIKYDSSIFPCKRHYGYFDTFKMEPVIVKTGNFEVVEFPQTVVDLGVFKVSCFGGGYLRLFPIALFYLMAKIIERKNRPLIVYIHPRDMDIHQPQFHFPLLKKIKHYINVSKTEKKLNSITGKFRFRSFEMLLTDAKFKEKLLQAKCYDFSMKHKSTCMIFHYVTFLLL